MSHHLFKGQLYFKANLPLFHNPARIFLPAAHFFFLNTNKFFYGLTLQKLYPPFYMFIPHGVILDDI